MKKNFLIIIFSFFLNISVVFALENEFIIDVDKININAKGNILIDGLDSTYNIETDGFSKTEEVNEGAKEYTKKLLELTLGDADLNERGRAMLRECYISTDNGFDTLSAYAFINSFIETENTSNLGENGSYGVFNFAVLGKGLEYRESENFIGFSQSNDKKFTYIYANELIEQTEFQEVIDGNS